MTTNSGANRVTRLWEMRLIRQMGAATLLVLLLAATAFAGLSPVYGNSAGTVKQVDIARLQDGWAVTAVENSADNLEVIVWNDNGTGIVRTGSATATLGAISKVAVSGLDSSRVVTADINSLTGDMDLTVWKVSFPAGTIAQQGATISVCCTTTSVAITQVDATHVATAATFAGNLFVNVFEISSAGVITADGETSGGVVNQAVIASPEPTRIVTADRNSSGKLDVTMWHFAFGFLTKKSEVTSGAIKHLAIVALLTDQVTTAVINGSGDLELINWGISSTGALTKQVSKTVGPVLQVAMCGAVLDQFTAVVGSSNKLDVAFWQSGSGPGTLFERETYNSATAITEIAVTLDFASSIGITDFITAARGSTGKLEVQVWQDI